MQIKGTAVRITPQYVKQSHPDKYNDWINSLSDESKKIMNNPIIATDWYDLTNSVLEPTEKIANLFFYGKKQIGLVVRSPNGR